MKKDSRIYIAGHNGLVGSAVLRELERRGYTEVITSDRDRLDLTDQKMVEHFFSFVKPEYVFLCAAKVGGIYANNKYPARFIYQNLAITTNVIHAAYNHGATKLLYLGSSCIYPKKAKQPIQESALLTGKLEPTNDAYAIAKIAGVKMCQAYRKQYGCNFIAAMPTNLYGPGDNFDEDYAHVIPGMIRRLDMHMGFDENLPFDVWGTGKPLREFMYVDDCARALVLLMKKYNEEEIINVGVGADISIADLVEIVSVAMEYTGLVRFDTTKPDGTPRKLLDITKLKELGFEPKMELMPGIRKTVNWYIKYVSDVP